MIQLRLEAATKEEQVKTRSTIQKQILKIIPIINGLKTDVVEATELKGMEIPIALQGYV